MAKDESESVFRALADQTRRQILQDLRGGELAAGEIAARFPIKGPSVSRHLSILRAAGLVSERRAANRIIYSLAEDRLALCVGGFLSAVCPDQIVLRHRRVGIGDREAAGQQLADAERVVVAHRPGQASEIAP